MGKTGGVYLNPITFFSDSYSNIDFSKEQFWNSEKSNWGNVTHNFNHSSTSIVRRGKTKIKIQCNEKILLSIDGLLCTSLPDDIASDEEALIILTNHISTFLAILSFGGLFFTPVSEKQIAHLELKDNTIRQLSGGGDRHSVVTMQRALYRWRIPYADHREWIDFNWVALRIIKKKDLEDCYNHGQQIVSKLHFQSSEAILFLEAYHNYTLHKWNNTLLLGWAFIEILIGKLWKEKIVNCTSPDEIGRKNSLNDNRTFSASVKLEILYSTNLLTKELYNHLNSLRSIRNALIHEGKFIAKIEVDVIFESCKQLIFIVSNVEPKIYHPGWMIPVGWLSDNLNGKDIQT